MDGGVDLDATSVREECKELRAHIVGNPTFYFKLRRAFANRRGLCASARSGRGVVRVRDRDMAVLSAGCLAVGVFSIGSVKLIQEGDGDFVPRTRGCSGTRRALGLSSHTPPFETHHRSSYS